MNLKENIQAVGDELSSEEKFFESALRTERFIKRYQKPLIVAVVSFVVLTAGLIGYQTYDGIKSENANKALNLLLVNPSDSEALKILKTDNHDLYELYQFSLAVKSGDGTELAALEKSSNSEIADMATYENAVLKKDYGSLASYAKRQNGIYQEMAQVITAVNNFEKNNVEAAHAGLALIKNESPMYPVAQSLLHYGIKE